MSKIYTGISSRKTPKIILDKIYVISQALAMSNYLLRSGGATGADETFESGHRLVTDKNIGVYLPWKNFNGRYTFYDIYDIPESAYNLASFIHPAWNNCSDGAKSLHARNVCQVLGLDMKTPSNFVICWTENGEYIGGTRTAMILADIMNIPIYNLGSSNFDESKILSQLTV